VPFVDGTRDDLFNAKLLKQNGNEDDIARVAGHTNHGALVIGNACGAQEILVSRIAYNGVGNYVRDSVDLVGIAVNYHDLLAVINKIKRKGRSEFSKTYNTKAIHNFYFLS
jgi:hypothetical protein